MTEDAVRLDTILQVRKEAHADGHELGPARVTILPLGDSSVSGEGSRLHALLHDGLVGNGRTENVSVEIAIDGDKFQGMASILDRGRVMIRFQDGTSYTLGPDSEAGESRPTLDQGDALLRPVSGFEHAAIERILSVLGEAVSDGRMTQWQENQILLIADMIRDARNDIAPDEGERWKIVGPVHRGLRYLAREGPKDALAWWKLVEILHGIDWHNVARSLPGG